jgi:hypothetical protein
MRHAILAILVGVLLLPLTALAATQSSPNYTNNAGRIVSGGGNAADSSGLRITGDVIGQGVFIPAGNTGNTGNPGNTIGPVALPAMGASAHTGDINGDGVVDIADALLALRATIGLTQLSSAETDRGDVSPLVSNVPVGDGRIDIEDSMLILRKAVGLGW